MQKNGPRQFLQWKNEGSEYVLFLGFLDLQHVQFVIGSKIMRYRGTYFFPQCHGRGGPIFCTFLHLPSCLLESWKWLTALKNVFSCDTPLNELWHRDCFSSNNAMTELQHGITGIPNYDLWSQQEAFTFVMFHWKGIVRIGAGMIDFRNSSHQK